MSTPTYALTPCTTPAPWYSPMRYLDPVKHTSDSTQPTSRETPPTHTHVRRSITTGMPTARDLPTALHMYPSPLMCSVNLDANMDPMSSWV